MSHNQLQHLETLPSYLLPLLLLFLMLLKLISHNSWCRNIQLIICQIICTDVHRNLAVSQ